MSTKNIIFKIPFDLEEMGMCLALGMAWHLDNGFWNIFIDALLGWIYVAFKLSQHLWVY